MKNTLRNILLIAREAKDGFQKANKMLHARMLRLFERVFVPHGSIGHCQCADGGSGFRLKLNMLTVA